MSGRGSDVSGCLGCLVLVSLAFVLAAVGSGVAHAGRMCGWW